MSKAEWVALTTPEGRGVWVKASAVEVVRDIGDEREVWTVHGGYDVSEPLADVLAALGIVPLPVATEPAPGSEEDWREALRVVREVEPEAYLDGDGPIVRQRAGRFTVWQAVGRGGFWAHDGTSIIHPTATAAARAYVASRRADPTPERIAEVRTGQAVDGPLRVDGWTLDLTEWQRGEDNEAAVRMGYDGSGINWRAIKPDGFPLKSGTAPTRAEALAAATAALRAHYGRPA